MKQSEKLDLILRELYKYKNDSKYYSIGWICENLNIPLDSLLELNKLAHRLKDDRLINTMFRHNDCMAELTTYGIEYCEEDSYLNSGHSIITNEYSISIVNSPNSNIVSQSTDVSITQNIEDINKTINEIKETVEQDPSVDSKILVEILECLNEIEQAVNNGNKPKFALKALLNIAGSISSISGLIMNLSQLF
jgi:hypothetical protein